MTLIFMCGSEELANMVSDPSCIPGRDDIVVFNDIQYRPIEVLRGYRVDAPMMQQHTLVLDKVVVKVEMV